MQGTKVTAHTLLQLVIASYEWVGPHRGMAGRSGMRSLRSRLSGGGAMRARCCSMRASLWMSSIFFGPSTFRRACQPCLSLKSMTSCMASIYFKMAAPQTGLL